MNCKGEKWGHNYTGGKCLNCGDLQVNLSPKKSRKDKEYEKENKELKKHKIEYSFQEIGVQMSQYFKGNIWWIFHKHPEWKIRDAFKVCKKAGIYKINYLLGILKK